MEGIHTCICEGCRTPASPLLPPPTDSFDHATCSEQIASRIRTYTYIWRAYIRIYTYIRTKPSRWATPGLTRNSDPVFVSECSNLATQFEMRPVSEILSRGVA